MTTQAIKDHPNDISGIDLDGPRTSAPSFQAPTANEYGVMKCTNIVTGEFEGYLGTATNNYLDLVSDISQAAQLKWYSYGSDVYLQKNQNRCLGVGAQSYACYGLWTSSGWVDAVLYNSDKSISLKSDPTRKLYKYGNGYVCWSGGESNQNILAFELDFS